jgi:hypothetical protein
MNISSQEFFSFAQIINLTPEEKVRENIYISGVFEEVSCGDIECSSCDSMFPCERQNVRGVYAPVREAPINAAFYKMKNFAPAGASVVQSFEGVTYYLIEDYPEIIMANEYHEHECLGTCR